jgi:hypothetical protein
MKTMMILSLFMMSFGAAAVSTDCPAKNQSERGYSAKMDTQKQQVKNQSVNAAKSKSI